MNYTLNRLVKAGDIAKEGSLYHATGKESKNCVSYQTNAGDCRLWPRIGKKFIDLGQLCKEVLTETPMTEEEVTKAVMNKITAMKGLMV